MIEAKETLIGNISSKKTLTGKINNAIEKVYPELEDIIITPTTEEQHFKSKKYGYNNINVQAVDNTIDSNIQSENIKSGVSILGINGEANILNGEEITINPTSEVQEITPTAPKNGFTKVIVNAQSGVDINDYFETNYTGSAYYMFIKKVPSNITIEGTSCNNMFANFSKLSEIPNLDTSKVTNVQSMFSGCSSLTTIPQLNTSKVTNMYQFCTNCSSLKIIPQLDTSNVTNMGYAFLGCNNLETIPKLNASKVNNIFWLLTSSNYLVNFGGLENLGMAYLTTQSANYSNYTLELSSCSKLTHDSLMNVINNLYDIKTKGCNVQQLVLGSTNLAKLTAEEINLATAKGFSVS